MRRRLREYNLIRFKIEVGGLEGHQFAWTFSDVKEQLDRNLIAPPDSWFKGIEG
jgi:hypothetical protein